MSPHNNASFNNTFSKLVINQPQTYKQLIHYNTRTSYVHSNQHDKAKERNLTLTQTFLNKQNKLTTTKERGEGMVSKCFDRKDAKNAN